MGMEDMLTQCRENGIQQFIQAPDCANTFSIVAYDPERKEWGVAVA
jgi:hypothetical protein